MSFLSTRQITCPENLLRLAQMHPAPRVVIAQAGASLPMQAARQAVTAGIMCPVFVGDKNRITQQAAALDWDISAYEICAATGEAEAAQIAAAICAAGEGDVLMKGHLHTDVFMKSILSRDNGLRTESRLVHLFHMTVPGAMNPLILSDCAVNVAPDMATKKAALGYCVEMLQMVQAGQPKIAILSATETPIASVPSSVTAEQLMRWAHDAHPEIDVVGPLALDLVLSQESAKIKGLSDNSVAGKANAVIVPDIVSGNVLFKSLVYLAGACAAGIVMGAKVPVLLTSRADPPQARLASVALAAIMASATKKP
jgi:phosphate acetyltransferase